MPGWSTSGHRLSPPILDTWLMSGPLGRFLVTCREAMSVACPGGSMDLLSCVWLAGFYLPTGPVKPARSGSGLPDRFDRKPVETGQIQNQIQNRMFNRFRTAYRSVWPVYRPVWPVYRSVWLVTGQIQFFFLFWFKFKCPQSILNKYLYNIF